MFEIENKRFYYVLFANIQLTNNYYAKYKIFKIFENLQLFDRDKIVIKNIKICNNFLSTIVLKIFIIKNITMLKFTSNIAKKFIVSKKLFIFIKKICERLLKQYRFNKFKFAKIISISNDDLTIAKNNKLTFLKQKNNNIIISNKI